LWPRAGRDQHGSRAPGKDRFVNTLQQTDVIGLDVHLMELRNAVSDEDPAAGADEARSLRETLAGIEPSTDQPGAQTPRPR
jgi:hypothetical protein